MINPRHAAGVIDSAIRVLYNSSKEDFNNIFGKAGPHLWEKFIDMKSNEGDFFCALDSDNQVKLAEAAIKYLIKNDRSLW